MPGSDDRGSKVVDGLEFHPSSILASGRSKPEPHAAPLSDPSVHAHGAPRPGSQPQAAQSYGSGPSRGGRAHGAASQHVEHYEVMQHAGGGGAQWLGSESNHRQAFGPEEAEADGYASIWGGGGGGLDGGEGERGRSWQQNSQQEPLKCGWLRKRTSGGWGWRKRWFVLSQVCACVRVCVRVRFRFLVSDLGFRV